MKEESAGAMEEQPEGGICHAITVEKGVAWRQHGQNANSGTSKI